MLFPVPVSPITRIRPRRVLVLLACVAALGQPRQALCQTSVAQSSVAQHDLAELHTQFQNPPADARPIMRWWWFGPAVTKPELKKELETMAANGIGGVEIQPVYPLMLDDESKGIRNLPYLSPEFLDDISFANRTARALGLRVDITLGSGWPYGGPHTPLALAAGCLRVKAVPITGTSVTPPALEPGDSFIAAFAVVGSEKSFDPATALRIDPATGHVPTPHTAYPTLRSRDPIPDAPRPTSETPDPRPKTPNRTALFFISSHTRQAVKRAAFGAEGFVLDHFARPAIDEHIADVATPLLNAFGDQPPYSVFSDSLEVYGSDWTPNLPAEFLKRRGYDLIPHLPELLAGGSPQADSVRHDWAVTLSDLIRENYLAPLTQFAESRHTQFRSQTYGQPAVTLADQAIPNLPEGEGPQWREFSYTRWATSAAHLYHRNVVSAETFTWLHSPAFRATPLDMKVEADRMFLLGVNQIVGHGWPYSPPAAGEPGWALYAAAVFNSHNPWFPVMPDIDRYLQRMSWLLRQGEPANDVAILLPEDDAQAAFSPGHDSVTDEMHKLITPELVSTILDAGYNLDFIDATAIDKLGVIPYPILVIPPTTRIPLATYKKISDWAASGGHVIAIGKLPSLAPGLKDESHSDLIADLTQQLFRPDHLAVFKLGLPAPNGLFLESIADLPAALHHDLSPDVELTPATPGIGFIHRKLPSADIYFVVNSTNQRITGSIRFRSIHSFLESWDPDSAQILSTTHTNVTALSLAPYESRVFILSDANPSTAESTTPQPTDSSGKHLYKTEDLSTGWQIRFLDTPHPTPDARYPPPDTPISPLASWTDLPNRQYFSGEAIYARTFTLDIDSAKSDVVLDFGRGTPTVDTRPPNSNGIHALLDPPIREAATVLVNGTRVGSLWHPPYQLNITSALHPGENTIEVHVYNTAINLLAGQPPRDLTALRARFGRRFDPQDMDNLKPIPSGLLGPITLEIQPSRMGSQAYPKSGSAPSR
jgi:hypothetical protein